MSRVFKNSLFNLVGTVITSLIATLSMRLIFQHLGAEEFTQISIYLTIVVIGALADLGVGKAIIIKLGSSKKVFNLPIIFSAGILYCFFLSLTFIISDLVLLNVWEASGMYREFLSKLIYLIPVLVFTTYFRSIIEFKENFILINLIRISSNLILYSCIGIMAYNKCEIPFIFLIVNCIKALQLVATFICSIDQYFQLIFNKTEILSLALLSLNLGIINILGTLIGYLDKLILPFILSILSISPYYLAVDISSKLWLLPGALWSAMFPMFIKDITQLSNLSKLKSINRLLMLGFTPVILALAFFGEQILLFLSAGLYSEKELVYLQITTIGIIVNSFNQINLYTLIGYRREKLLLRINLLITLAYVPILLFTAKYLGVLGVSYAFTFRLIVDALILRKYARIYNTYKFGYEIGYCLIVIILFLVSPVITSILIKTISMVVICLYMSFYIRREWNEIRMLG